MWRNTLALALVVLVAAPALAQRGRIPWRQVELTAQDLAEDTRRTYLEASGASDRETSRSLFAVWASSQALHALVAGAPETAEQVHEAMGFLEADMAKAGEALRRARVAASIRASFTHCRETLERLRQKLGGGGGYGHEEPPEPEPVQVLDLTLSSDGWHGNLFDRYTRLSGQFTGLDLRQADLIVTDAQGYSLWQRSDAFPEIKRYYDTHTFIRPQVVEIPFNLKFYLKSVPPDAAWIYVRLRDRQGNYKDQAVPIPR